MIEVVGKAGISVKVVAHSKSEQTGEEMLGFEVSLHRWTLAEINKHRMLSNNYQSSRAVKIETAIQNVIDNPAVPIKWGKEKSGMQSGDNLTPTDHFEFDLNGDIYVDTLQNLWKRAAKAVAFIAKGFVNIGLHKQWVGRLIEPFSMTRGVISGTEFDNFFYLRCHEDAQPEFQELANLMYKAKLMSTPEVLEPGQWHLSYVKVERLGVGLDKYYTLDGSRELTLEEAKQLSAASCAQASFRALDQSPEKVDRVWSRLVDTKQPHSVCLEHQATPMVRSQYSPYQDIDPSTWDEGITHVDNNGRLWSGNLKGWIQHRKLLPNDTCWDYKP